MEGLISIIIPVYNSIENLGRCIDSILIQSYQNLEIIIVDDGSADGSTELCLEYEKKDSRIRLIVKENEGVSAARNVGISLAQGEYLQFVDSDDFLYPDTCEKFAAYMRQESADVVVCGYEMLRDHSMKRPKSGFFFDAKELMPNFSQYFHHNHNMINVPWNKMYQKSAVTTKFPEDLSKGEDLLFNLDILEKANGILFVEDVLYHYDNTKEGSLSTKFREDGFEIEERLFQSVQNFYNRNAKESQAHFLYDNYLDGIKGKIIALIKISGKTKKECISIIKIWIRKPTVRLLVNNINGFGPKDKILLYLIKFKMAGLIYNYYRFLYK